MLPFIRRVLLGDSRKLGRWGERRSCRYLKGKGYRLITQNFRCNSGEVDIVMADGDSLVFVEVKTRRNENTASAQSAVNSNKRQRLTRAANRFVRQYKITNKPLRFDVMAVVLGDKGSPEIRHYKNAFVP
jgi:putative endonuclease